MQSKLTLSINKQVIERAKRFAKRSNRSLSELIETYLDRITQDSEDAVDSEIEELVGIINLPADFNEKEGIRDILREKYL